jgi:hypothetical protein
LDQDRAIEVLSRFREASNLYTRYRGGIRLRMEVIFKLSGYLQQNVGKLEAMQELYVVVFIVFV